jgi:hypothetical protein
MTMRLIVLAAVALALGGCVASGSLAARGVSIDQGVGSLSNRAILLNLARASQAEPLYFVSIGNVQAQGTTDLRLSAPGFIYGNHLTPIQRQLNFGPTGTAYLDNTINTNFQLGVFNTQTFYEGMLQPLGLNDIDSLLHQGFPREMIFYLVIDKVKITPCPEPLQLPGAMPKNDPCIVYNDPGNPSYALFKQAIEDAMEHGLTTEVPSSNTTIADATGPTGGASGGQTQTLGATVDGKAGDVSFVIKPPPDEAKAQLCFELALSTAAAKKEFKTLDVDSDVSKHPFYCGTGHKRGNGALTVQLIPGEDFEVVVTTRSIYGMFNYLGASIANPQSTPVLQDFKVPNEVTPEGPLLTVNTGEILVGCFAAVSYENQNYCVPQKDAKMTKQVFNVLSVLVALKQSPGDLPASQTVLIAP